MSAFVLTLGVLTTVLTPFAIRTSRLSGFRAFFALAAGGGHLSIWAGVFVWQQEMTPIVFAASGFAVLGWLLIVGGRFQMALAHDAEYKRYMRGTTLLQRLSGYSPPLLPPFSIDMRWLLGGVANSAAALFLAIIIPSQFLLAWGETLVGAFMIVASAGGFSPKRPEDASESQRTTD